MPFFGIILIAGVILSVIIYNGLIVKKNQVSNVFASIDALLKKRYDLIPNLTSSVKTFIGSAICVAVPYKKDLFEPNIFRTLADIEPIHEYFDDLKLAVGIVEDLNLNTRLWSRQ